MSKKYLPLLIICLFSVFSACTKRNNYPIARAYDEENEKQLKALLTQKDLPNERRYAIINSIASKYISQREYSKAIIYLTDWVENTPTDKYNAYWLLMTAYAYTRIESEPIAEYYFDRIINNYPDLMVQGKSVHFMCLQNLIQISTSSENRIRYFNELINRFPSSISITEMYMYLAREYEAIGEWDMSMKTYKMFLEQPDAASIQIPGIPDAYNYTRTLTGFNESPKNWTFKSLDALADAVKTAISRYQPNQLDKYRAKVNFFSVSWKQDEDASTAQAGFSMQSFMHGNRITFNKELIPGPTQNEAYLRTSGWTTGVPVWYFYFREVNFPADPDIHGRWEWAGIYIGEKL